MRSLVRLLLGALFYGGSIGTNRFYSSNGLCGWQNGGALCPPIAIGNGTASCCSVNGFCGVNETYCLISNGCQSGCTDSNNATIPPSIPPPPAKLTGSERDGIIFGSVVLFALVVAIVSWFVPWKTIQALRRPLDLFDLYGYSGIFLFLLGNRTTWRTEAYVIGKMNDEDALNFKKSVQDECTMISVAAAIVAQIAVTSLSLNNLSQTHWIARALMVFSIISSLMAVYYAATQQRTMGRLLQPTQVRGWIRGQLPPQRLNSLWKYEPANRPRSDPDHYRPLQSSSSIATNDLMRSCFTPSVASVVTMSAPQILLSTSLFTLILALGVYFGFTWTRNIDIYAQEGDSRNVMVMFLVSTVVCFMVYSLSALIQDDDTSTEKMILFDYINDYVERHPHFASTWVPAEPRSRENNEVELATLSISPESEA